MPADTDTLPEALADEIRRRVFAPGLIRLTQTLTRQGQPFRISLRPVRIKGQDLWQAEMRDGTQAKTRNLSEPAARKGLEDILAQTGKRELHLVTREGDLHVRVGKRGTPLVSRGKPKAAPGAPAAPAGNDRAKRQPLTDFDSAALLRVLGIAGADGAVRASMRGKYDQVNALLRALEPLLPEAPPPAFSIVDCGYGKAYLTLALHAYLTQAKGWRGVSTLGVDRNPGVVESAQAMAQALRPEGEIAFRCADIKDVSPERAPDLVMSLHACDTATDDALLLAIRAKAQRILCVPCCQHELHHALAGGGPMRAVLRHGILRERLADLLTDTFRAQILRICGYRAAVMEFVSPEATGRNLLIRAQRGLRPGLGEAVAEYEALRDFWGVTPYIAQALGEGAGRDGDGGR